MKMRLAVLVLLYTLHSSLSAREVVVGPEDTPWGLAQIHLKDPGRWPEILKLNGLPPDPSWIFPGMRIRIPPDEETAPSAQPSSALVAIQNDVRVRFQGEMDFESAQLNMELKNEDSLRTYPDSLAKLKFPSGEVLQVDENSFLVMKPLGERETLSLLSGEVRVSRARVLTPTAKIIPQGDSDYRARIQEDKSTLVQVFKGSPVDVLAKGKLVTVPQGFSSEIKLNLPPTEAAPIPKEELKRHLSEGAKFERMPTAPRARSENSRVAPMGTPPPAVILKRPPSPPRPISSAQTQTSPKSSLEAALSEKEIRRGIETQAGKGGVRYENITHYRLQISKSKDFSSLLLDELGSMDEGPKRPPLEDGDYYLRFVYLDASGREIMKSGNKFFAIDTKPPVLEVTNPAGDESVREEIYQVRGASEPGARVDVNGRVVSMERNGRFFTYVNLSIGANILKITARDRAGNATALTRTLTRAQ